MHTQRDYHPLPHPALLPPVWDCIELLLLPPPPLPTLPGDPRPFPRSASRLLYDPRPPRPGRRPPPPP
ncbi:hypothetical protein Hanom_Chr06g00500951 [Helianthus anomalus]